MYIFPPYHNMWTMTVGTGSNIQTREAKVNTTRPPAGPVLTLGHTRRGVLGKQTRDRRQYHRTQIQVHTLPSICGSSGILFLTLSGSSSSTSYITYSLVYPFLEKACDQDSVYCVCVCCTPILRYSILFQVLCCSVNIHFFIPLTVVFLPIFLQK